MYKYIIQYMKIHRTMKYLKFTRNQTLSIYVLNYFQNLHINLHKNPQSISTALSSASNRDYSLNHSPQC